VLLSLLFMGLVVSSWSLWYGADGAGRSDVTHVIGEGTYVVHREVSREEIWRHRSARLLNPFSGCGNPFCKSA
jgi:hypothetical protein